MTVKNEQTKEKLIEKIELLEAKVDWYKGQFKKF